MVCAVFIYDARALVLTGLMLFLPFLDRHWHTSVYALMNRIEQSGLESSTLRISWARLTEWISPVVGRRQSNTSRTRFSNGMLISLAIIVSGLTLVWFNPQHANTALIILLFTALPEEWFFRAYALTRVEQLITDKMTNLSPHKILWLANIITSVFFALVHLPTQGAAGLMVLLPSLLFGWLYQVYRDLPLVILLHTLSNLVFIIYIRDMLLIHL